MKIDWDEFFARCANIASRIVKEYTPRDGLIRIYGVPRGGCFVALQVRNYLRSRGLEATITTQPNFAHVIIDDIIDSGITEEKYKKYTVPFFAAVDKRLETIGEWVEFPWEQNETGPEDAVVRLLQYIGEDPNREGLRKTPARVVRSYDELFGGYKQKVEDLMTVFEDGACQEMVVLKSVEMSSACEHHMLPFRGVAHVGYIPNKRVIGVSKLARLVDMFSRRLQIQERIGQQVTSALDEYLQPLGSACVIEAQHLCMACRGVMKQNSVMVTSSLTGEFLNKIEVRQEFMSLIKS